MTRTSFSSILLNFWAMSRQQLLLLGRYPVNMAANFLLVLVLVIMVTLVVMIFSPAEAEASFRGTTLYGFIIYLFLSHTIWTVGMEIHREKSAGTLTSFYLSPASRFLNLLARAAVTWLWTGVAAVIGLVLVQLITGPLAIENIGLAMGILALTVSSLLGLAFALAGLALLFGDSIEIVANLLEFSLMGLCALFFPFAVLPPALLKLSRLIPLSYSVDAFRSVALGRAEPELLPLNTELALVAIAGVAGPLLGYWIYRRCEARIRRQGNL